MYNDVNIDVNIDTRAYHGAAVNTSFLCTHAHTTGGADIKNKAHSTDFHLKIRIGTRMYMDMLPVFTLLRLSVLREHIEPVQYNFTRETQAWDDTRATLMKEASLP